MYPSFAGDSLAMMFQLIVCLVGVCASLIGWVWTARV